VIDLSKLEKYINDISIETKKIHKKLKSENAAILDDPDRIGSLKYSVIVIAEAIAHTLHHILAKEHKISASGYKEVLIKSREYQLISSELSNNLQPFINFRNMLVHHYWKVADALFLKNLRDGLEDFQNFVSTIKTYMQDISQKSSDSE
jgi:uncharacterized protein YutE (UPF0331/DUF86 family)